MVDPTTLQPISVDEFTLGCKVPDHNGPLAQGWEANGKWKDSGMTDRNNPTVPDGEIDPRDFGEWYPFAKCMKNALQLIEGQAYKPEIMIKKEVQKVGYKYETFEHRRPHIDDGSENGQELMSDAVLAGRPIGMSSIATGWRKFLWRDVKNADESINQAFHGAGSRFMESKDGSDSMVGRCEKFLPDHAKKNAAPYDITVFIALCLRRF